MLLGLEPALARGRGRPRRATALRLGEGGLHQRADLVARVLEIPRLVPCRLAGDPEASARVEPMPREGAQALPGPIREAFDGVEIDTHVVLARHLVHILPAGARGTDPAHR